MPVKFGLLRNASGGDDVGNASGKRFNRMNTPPSREQRQSPRIDFRIEVRIKGYPGKRGVRDFSLHGLFIETQSPSEFKMEDEISLVMRLPPEKRAIEVKARVVRVSRNGIGVEFVGLSPKDAMSMEYCFHIFKHTVPLPGT